jgi:hypothetical protein
MATSRPNDASAHGAATRTSGAHRPLSRRHMPVRNPVHHTHHYPHHLRPDTAGWRGWPLGSGVQQHPASGGALHEYLELPAHVSSDLATGVTPASMGGLPGNTRPLPAGKPDTFLGERYRRLVKRRASSRPWSPWPARSWSSSGTCWPTASPATMTLAGLLCPADCVTRTRYLLILLLTCRNAAHWCAVSGNVERPCAAKKRPDRCRAEGKTGREIRCCITAQGQAPGR